MSVDPIGYNFIARLPKSEQCRKYHKMVLTDGGDLFIRWCDGKWHRLRQATATDRAVAATCFRTNTEMIWRRKLVLVDVETTVDNETRQLVIIFTWSDGSRSLSVLCGRKCAFPNRAVRRLARKLLKNNPKKIPV